MHLQKSQQLCTCREGHIELKGLDEEVYWLRSLRASMYSHQFCRKLCCDITSHFSKQPIGRDISVDAIGSRFNLAKMARRHTAYPAELDDDDSLPQTLPPVSPHTATDPIQQLKDLNVSTIKIDDTNISQIVNILDQQLLKASILTLIDYMTKFGLPGQPSSRLFVNPKQPGEPEHIAARTLLNLLKDYFTTHAMLAQTYPQRLHIIPDADFQSPQDRRHRLLIWHDKDGRTTIIMDWDYDTQTFEHKQRCTNDISVVISMTGKFSPLGNDIVNEIRRRVRSKTYIPHVPSQAIVPLPL